MSEINILLPLIIQLCKAQIDFLAIENSTNVSASFILGDMSHLPKLNSIFSTHSMWYRDRQFNYFYEDQSRLERGKSD